MNDGPIEKKYIIGTDATIEFKLPDGTIKKYEGSLGDITFSEDKWEHMHQYTFPTQRTYSFPFELFYEKMPEDKTSILIRLHRRGIRLRKENE